MIRFAFCLNIALYLATIFVATRIMKILNLILDFVNKYEIDIYFVLIFCIAAYILFMFAIIKYSLWYIDLIRE